MNGRHLSDDDPDAGFLLQVGGLTKAFLGLVAVDNLSFELRWREILGLIGPNGAGKTTVFNLITKIYPPDAGRIVFAGQDITRFSAHAVNRLGIARTFQNIRLFSGLTVFDNVAAAFAARSGTTKLDALLSSRRMQQADRMVAEKVVLLLRQAGLAERADVAAGSLPYGDQRRLEIVRALATAPRLLLLDEPTAGMNPTETAALLEMVREIRDTGLSVLLIGHDMRFIMRLCDRIVVLNHGKKIAEGSPREIQGNEAVIQAYLGRSGKC